MMRSSSSSGSVLPAVEQRGERDAALEAHHHVRSVVDLEHRVHAHDAAVVEPGERARLLDEALEAPSVAVAKLSVRERIVASGMRVANSTGRYSLIATR